MWFVYVAYTPILLFWPVLFAWMDALGFVGSHFWAYLLAGIASGILVNVFVDGWMM